MADWDFLDEVDVLTKLPANFNELRESKKWQERKEALEALVAALDANPRLSPKANYGEIMGNLQLMIAKDANINCTALAAKAVTGFANGLRQKFAQHAQALFPSIFEKLKEKKALLREPLVECLDAVAATIASVELIQDDVMTYLAKPNPQIKQQVALFLFRQFNKLTADKAPKKALKVLVPQLGKLTSDADADVRDAASSAIAAVQRMIGEKNVRAILGDLANDDAKMKKIGEYLEKAQSEHNDHLAKTAPPAAAAPAAEPESASGSGSAPSSSHGAAAAAAPAVEEDPFDFLEPVDVLAKLPETFQTNMESKKWLERKEALESLLDLMTKNPRLDPKANYGDIVAQLKRTIEKDANINVGAAAAKCLKGLAEGLRKKFAPHAPAVVPSILEKFKEKKPVLRDPLVECIDAVSKTISLETMQDDLVAAMEKPNPNIKIQIDLFLYRTFKTLNMATMPKKTLKALIPILIKHSGDSDPEVRDASYAALGSAMRAIGEKACLPLIADIVDDNLKMTKVKEFYAKAQQEVGPEVVQQMIQSVHKADAPPAAKGPPKKPLSRAPSKESVNKEEDEESLKPPGGGPAKKLETEKKAVKKEEPAKEAKTSPPKGPEIPLLLNDDKPQRIKDEKTLKILKWNFSSPTEEHISQLQEMLSTVAKAGLSGLLFHKDFKMHIKACELLTQTGQTTPEALIKNSDLLLKWCTLRFLETNPAVMIKVLELSRQIVQLLRGSDETMSTEELNAFVPYLLLKSGESKDAMRSIVRDIVEELTDINGPSKMAPMIIEATKSKNARQRSECLQYLEMYITRSGVLPLKSLGIHKTLAAQVGDRDQSVRSAAINALVACYREEGDQMWRSVGKMPEKDRSLVEERIKRAGVAPGSAPARGDATPRNGAKVVVPNGGNQTVVRRPGSAARGRSSSRARDRSPDDDGQPGALNGTIDLGRGGENMMETPQRGRPLVPSSSRYAIDEEFVQVGQSAMASAAAMQDINFGHSYATRPAAAPTTPLRRTGSSSSISSIDTMDQLERVIMNVSSELYDVAKEAFEQVSYMLSVEEQRALLEERISLVMKAVATQINYCRTRNMIGTERGKSMLRLALNFLNGLATANRLYLDEESMSEWLSALVHLLCDPNLEVSQEAQAGNKRAFNLITIRVCGRVDATVFYAACLRCLTSGLLENPDSEPVALFLKCLFKWQDNMQKKPQPLRLNVFLDDTNEFFNKIFALAQESEASMYDDVARAVDNSLETALTVMGDVVLDGVRRVRNPHPHLISYVNACMDALRKISDEWKPLLPGAVAEDLPQPRAKRADSASTMRNEVHILVDNVIRDLSSYDRHVKALCEYLEKNPAELTTYNDYVQTAPLGAIVPDLIAAYKKGVRLAPMFITQTQVSLAQAMPRYMSRYNSLMAASQDNAMTTSALQNRDINSESVSGSLTIPAHLNRAAAAEQPAQKKRTRRTIDPATFGSIQARLAGMDD